MTSRSDDRSPVSEALADEETRPLQAVSSHRRRGFAFWQRSWWTPLRIVSFILLICVLVGLSYGAVDAISRARRIAAEASDGIQHLRAAQSLLPRSGSLAAVLDPTTLGNIKGDLVAADADFSRLHVDLAQPSGTVAIAAHAPVLSDAVHSLAMLAAAADEACRAGLDLVSIGQTASSILKGGLFAGSSAPAPGSPPATQLNAQTYAAVQMTFADATSHIDSAAAYLGEVNLAAIPNQLVKPPEMTLLRKTIAEVPQAQALIAEANSWLAVLGSIAGVGTPSSYLIELMDRSELRPVGGFMGNYGIITVANGRIQPFDLNDTYNLDLPFFHSGGKIPLPRAYSSWWPFPNYGLRDSNLSANFPESAQLGIQALKIESGQHVQGVIAVTPTAIARAMTVVGNLKVVIPEAGINEIVTPQNLESKIHYYQQTKAYDPITGLPPSDEVSSPRKRFTALLGRAFIAKLHGLPTSQLSALAQQMMESVHTRDIQIYFTNQSAEQLLAANGDDSSLAHAPGDGLSVVDDNVGVNKGSQFNVLDIVDHVSIGADGSATHQLAVAYNFHVTNVNLLFGPDRYKTYLRIYAPPQAQLIHQDGFQNLWGGDQIGHSDEPGRQMWGGYVEVQDGVPYTLHLTWRVANVLIENSARGVDYKLDVQRQPGANVHLALTIAAAGAKTFAVNDSHTLLVNAKYSVPFVCLASLPCSASSNIVSPHGSSSQQSAVSSAESGGIPANSAVFLDATAIARLDRRIA